MDAMCKQTNKDKGSLLIEVHTVFVCVCGSDCCWSFSLEEIRFPWNLSDFSEKKAFLFFVYNFFLKNFFMTWIIFKAFIECVTVLLLFYVSVFWPRGMWNLSFRIRDGTHISWIGRQSLNRWTTTREVPHLQLITMTPWYKQCSWMQCSKYWHRDQ